MTFLLNTRIADVVSISLSGLCTLHCLLLPSLLVLSPAIGGLFISDEYFHKALVFLTLPISTLSLFLGCRKHRNYAIGFIGAVGLIMISSAVAAEALLHIHNEYFETIATVAGSLFLVTAHVKNFRLCRQQKCPCPSEQA